MSEHDTIRRLGRATLKALASGVAILTLVFASHVAALPAPEVGRPLTPWSEGELDIHHINTGRGEAALLILPDGTGLLVDASGKTLEQPPFSLPTRPDATRPPRRMGRAVRPACPPRRLPSDRLCAAVPLPRRPHGRGGRGVSPGA